MEGSVFLCIDQLLKTTTSSNDLSCSSTEDPFNQLREIIECEPELSKMLSLVHHDGLKPKRKPSSLYLDWTLSLCAQLTVLDRHFQPSVSQEKSVQSLFTLLVSLGIRPNLLPCLRISKCLPDETNAGLKHRRLVSSLVVLLQFSFSSRFAAGLLQRHLVDILAALCQLCYAPILKVALKDNETSIAISTEYSQNGDFDSFKSLFSSIRELEEKVLSVEELTSEMWAERQVLTVQLDRLQSTVYQPLFVQALLTLQNTKCKPKPGWLKVCCGQMLSSALLRQPSGLINVLEGMLQDVPPVSQDVPDILQSRCQAIAQLLMHTPAQCSSTQQYLTIIAPQVLQLLCSKPSSNEKYLNQVSISFLSLLQSTQPTLAKEFLFDYLLEPLAHLLNEEDMFLLKDNILISSEKLEETLQTLHKIFDLCGPERIILAEPLLLPISKILLELASACGTSHLRKCTLELLQTSLESLDSVAALNWLDNALCTTPLKFKFQRTSSGSMEAIPFDGPRIEKDLLEVEAQTEVLWYLVEKLNSLQASLFTQLLQKLSLQHLEGNCLTNAVIPLLLVERMAETIEPDQLLKDTEKVANTLKSMLSCFLTMSRNKSADYHKEANLVDTETPLLALTLISLLLQHTKLASSDWQYLQCLVEILEEISNLPSLPDGTRRVAKELRIAIATRGAVPQPKPDAGFLKEGKHPDSFECAWRYLLDPEIPLKCHGLILIRRLLLRSDPETLKHSKIILEALQQEHLLHQDSCVYQSAIQALAALARSSLKEVVTVLTTTFACPTNQLETRLKVAEALVQICRQEHVLLTTQDKEKLLVTFLYVSKEINSVLRTSTLSCLADICRVMKFAICPQLQEVLMCLVSFLRFDSEVDVKRAAAMALTHLLRGLGKDIFQVLKDELRDVHRVLVHAEKTETDERLVLHLHLALEEIKDAIRQSLQKSNTPTKEIRILDPF